MKTRIPGLLFALSFLGLLSCQNERSTNSSASDDIPLALRLTAESGNAIPEADTLRFVVTVGSKTIDTSVEWSAHELDLGSVKDGDRIQWQATGWKWDSTKTVRRVVWASKVLQVTARSSGNSVAFTLETPVKDSSYTLPKLNPEGFAVEGTGKVSRPYSDSVFHFAFKSSGGIEAVRIDDSLVQAKDGVYSREYTLSPGWDRVVKVVLRDTLGSISILVFTVSRAPAPVVVDSSLDVAFEVPADTTVSYIDSNLSVRVKTTSKLHVDTVRVGSTLLSKSIGDSTLWTGRIDRIKVGTDTLRAIAIAGVKRDTAKRAVTRLAEGKIDSSLEVAFVVTGDTVLSFADSNLFVRVKTTSKLPVDSVRVEATGLSKDAGDSTLWTGRIDGLKVGKDTLLAIAFAGAKQDTTKRVVTRLAKETIDSTLDVAFEVPGDTTISFADSNLSVRVKTTSKLHVDTVRVGSTRLSKDAGDSTLWTGRIDGLKVGRSDLVAIAFAGSRADTARRGVTRLDEGKVDSSLVVAFEVPGDTTLSNADSNLSVRVRTTSKLHVDTVRVGSTRLSKDAGDSTLWTGRIEGIKVGTDTLRAIAIAGSKRDTVKRVVTRKARDVVDSSISVRFRSPSNRSIRYQDSLLTVDVAVVSKQSVMSVLVGNDSLNRYGTGDSLWSGVVHGLKVGDNTLTAIATTSLRKDSAKFVVTRGQDSTISTSFLEPAGDTILPTNATSLQVKLKVATKLPIASVVVVGKDSLTRSADNDSIWSGTVNDLVEGANALQFVVTAGAKTDTVKKTVNRASDSSIAVVFLTPKNDTILRNSVSSVAVTVQVTSKLDVASVKIGDVSLDWDGAGSDLWRGTVPNLKVGQDTLFAKATAGVKTGTGQRIVTRRDTVGAPTFSPSSGSHAGTMKVALKAEAGATIEYKQDIAGWQVYTDSLTVSKSQTIYARAFKKGTTTTPGTDTALASAAYVIATLPPTFGASSGAHLDSVRVAINSGTFGAIRMWSTDRSSWSQNTTDSVTLYKTDSLFAWDSLPGLAASAVVAARFEVVATKPVINPRGGSFVGSKSVAIATTTTDGSIEYSIDKSKWTKYEGALSIDSNATLWARTTKNGLTTSALDSGEFKIAAKPPIFKKAGVPSTGGAFNTLTNVTILPETIGSTVSWSTDGTTWKSYSAAGISLDTTTTLWARATKSGLEPSAPVRATFTDTAFGYKLKNSPRPSAGCGKTGLTSGTYAMSVGGSSRTYVIKLPTGYDASKPYRLVFGMHAMGGSAASIASVSGSNGSGANWYNLVQQDAENSTIWVAPQGDASGTWTGGAADHMFIDTLLYNLKQNVCIDTTRVFSVGFSFGAMFTHSLARSHQRVFRGVVVYATAEYNIWSAPDTSTLPLAWMGTVGLSDATTPAAGQSGKNNGGRGARNRFVNYNGGDSSQTATETTGGSKAHVCYDYSMVKERHPVKWCTFDGGHMYDPADGSTSSSGTLSWVPAESWKFITQF